MTKQIFVLSIVLLISIVINVGFIFNKVAGKGRATSRPETAAVVSGAVVNRFEGQADLLNGFIVELTALKNIAAKEGAVNTVKAVEKLLTIKQSQVGASGSETPKSSKVRG